MIAARVPGNNLFQAKSTMAQKSLYIYRSDECEKLFKISVFHVCLFGFIHTVKFFRGAQIYEKKTHIKKVYTYICLGGGNVRII